MVTATAFQILVSNNAPIQAVTDNAIVTLEVRLSMQQRGVKDSGFPFGSTLILSCRCVFQGVLPGAAEDAPTVVIAAHYDSFGLAPVSHVNLIKQFVTLVDGRCADETSAPAV